MRKIIPDQPFLSGYLLNDTGFPGHRVHDMSIPLSDNLETRFLPQNSRRNGTDRQHRFAVTRQATRLTNAVHMTHFERVVINANLFTVRSPPHKTPSRQPSQSPLQVVILVVWRRAWAACWSNVVHPIRKSPDPANVEVNLDRIAVARSK